MNTSFPVQKQSIPPQQLNAHSSCGGNQLAVSNVGRGEIPSRKDELGLNKKAKTQKSTGKKIAWGDVLLYCGTTLSLMTAAFLYGKAKTSEKAYNQIVSFAKKTVQYIKSKDFRDDIIDSAIDAVL